jgi:hypothetical protein
MLSALLSLLLNPYFKMIVIIVFPCAYLNPCHPIKLVTANNLLVNRLHPRFKLAVIDLISAQFKSQVGTEILMSVKNKNLWLINSPHPPQSLRGS